MKLPRSEFPNSCSWCTKSSYGGTPAVSQLLILVRDKRNTVAQGHDVPPAACQPSSSRLPLTAMATVTVSHKQLPTFKTTPVFHSHTQGYGHGHSHGGTSATAMMSHLPASLVPGCFSWTWQWTRSLPRTWWNICHGHGEPPASFTSSLLHGCFSWTMPRTRTRPPTQPRPRLRLWLRPWSW